MIAFSTVCCCFCWISISWFALNKSITVDESINNSTYITPSWRAQSSQKISCWSHAFPRSLFCSPSTFGLSPCIPHTDRLKPVTLALVLELMTSNCWKLVRHETSDEPPMFQRWMGCGCFDELKHASFFKVTFWFPKWRSRWVQTRSLWRTW